MFLTESWPTLICQKIFRIKIYFYDLSKYMNWQSRFSPVSLEGLDSKVPNTSTEALCGFSPIRWSGGHWRHSLEWVVDHQRKMITSGVWILLMEEVPWCNGKQVNRACNNWAPSPTLTLHKTDNIDHLEVCPHHVSDSYPHQLIREQRVSGVKDPGGLFRQSELLRWKISQ